MTTSQHKKELIFVIVFLLAVFLFFSTRVWADTTAVLRPTVDGGNDSVDWTNTTGATCNTVDCSLGVQETSGASCTNSDGDTTFVSSSVNDANQTFNLDGSGIPNSATVTGVSVTACYKWQGGGATAPTFETRICLDNTCSNSGTTITGSASYAETTQSHTVDFRKTSTSDVEIGMVKTNTKNIRVSQISAVITYTPDTTAPAAVSNLSASNATASSIDLSWAAPGNDGSTGTATSYDIRYSTTTITDGNFSSAAQVSGEPAPSVAGSSQSMTISGLSVSTTYYFALKTSDEVPNTSGLSNVASTTTLASGGGSSSATPSTGGSGGGVAPTNVFVTGQAYPGSKIEFLRKSIQDEIFRYTPEATSTISADGAFQIRLVGLLSGEYLFALRAEDKDGRKTGILGLNADLSGIGSSLQAKDIIMPPTADFESALISLGKEIKIKGYAAPERKIEIEIDGILKGETKSDQNGFWFFATSTASFRIGDHYARAKQTDVNGKASEFSSSRSFRVSLLASPKADFNNDNKVTITDWSIFLFRWGSEDKVLKAKIDMNDDGKIDISDFSIFLKAMRI